MEEKVSDALLCPGCGYDLRTQVEQRARRCPECSLVLPDIPPEPADTYRERYRHCLEAMRVRFKEGWHDPPPKRRRDMEKFTARHLHKILLGLFLIVLIWSGINPRDRFTWILEVAPAVTGVTILIATYRRFRFTDLAYILIFIHAVILCVGGRYTYAEVPLFNWIRDIFDLSRNHYDRVGHFAQGFVPAILAREVLLRTSPLRPGKWLSFIVVCFCLALSAAYELIEWAVAAMTGTAADAFLGTQGDVWDTQKDMALALIGAITSFVLLSRYHDRALRATPVAPQPN